MHLFEIKLLNIKKKIIYWLKFNLKNILINKFIFKKFLDFLRCYHFKSKSLSLMIKRRIYNFLVTHFF